MVSFDTLKTSNMTAKAKAIQVLVAVSVTAVAYTLYTNSSGKKPAPAQVKNETAIRADKKQDAQRKAVGETTAVYNENAVPGYSNPEESGK